MNANLLRRSEATTFAPCHVTAFFVPNIQPKEPQRTGSWGAGMCLGTGVVATVEAEEADQAAIGVTRRHGDGDAKVTREALRQLLGDRPIEVSCTVTEGAPEGQGFGVSGASALSAAFALARCLGKGRSKAMKAAHLAEVRHRTGLGDVVSSFLGGAVLRTSPGIAPYGSQKRLPAKGDVVAVTIGEDLDTDALLRDEAVMERVTEVGSDCTESVAENPSLESIFQAGAHFTRETGLVDDDVLTAIDVAREGGQAMAAMLGNTVIAYGDTETLVDVLSAHGNPSVIPLDEQGLRLFDKDQLDEALGGR
ncbi:hypothetical protein BRD56_00865 [Thermoplasmatales archaeon SW_10_69_26]|nr:MAG: hypothetical protein BRD56_00865 [Thermoplasmatales archaeon SW_10_69_26]